VRQGNRTDKPGFTRGAAREKILPCSAVVDLQSETIDRRRGAAASVGSVDRFGASREATVRKGGDFFP
jgi:hypothetical protein